MIATDQLFSEMMGRYSGDVRDEQSCRLVRMPGFLSGNTSVIIYFSCTDCATEEAKAAKAGGKVVKPKFSIAQYGYVSLVTDTEGNMIGLHSMK
jgi:predicted enzyme related to lactoylglutathione lyase